MKACLFIPATPSFQYRLKEDIPEKGGEKTPAHIREYTAWKRYQ